MSDARWPVHLLGTREQWKKREAQWKAFHEWERTRRDGRTPAERLVLAGAMGEWLKRGRRRPEPVEERVARLAEGVAAMRRALAKLGARP